ncbi:MAG TPA: biotin/lipoyl-containing protein, partial [Candidatus Acidoferrales bacterium]|nr:biotin/lipoyl-containing protein [Candidatus Acidoferrales bacterium]
MPRVTMPQLGESVAEGTIGRWLKQVGDHVTKYEPIVEVITDKVNAEVPSPFEGVLSEILVEEGATVPNGAEIAVIQDAGSAAVATASQVVATPADAVQAARPTPTPAALGPAAPGPPEMPAPGGPREAYQGPVTPAVRRMARENGVDLADVRGTGHGGRVTRDDVIAFVEARRSGAGAGSAVASAAPSEPPAPVGSLARPAGHSPATA